MRTRHGARPRTRGDADAAIDQADPFAVPAATRRHEIKGSATIVALCGAWLLVSPIVLPYETGVIIVLALLSGGATDAARRRSPDSSGRR